ncbi:hypothetical protein DM558_06150 [Entomomonas moraniae]|uniref:Uncharacterized protein n=1 Tax=Entomomonas moraniae TaxID=2213226 RepID=A0A3S9XD73_9GAMM|nr:hypothetical protein [Entomomonas moraniae]AZS50382.1 hypothetical protein DM558_06150 [Entomomonas moraniae]
MSNVIPFSQSYRKTYEGKIYLSDIESAAIALGFHLRTMEGLGADDKELEFIESLDQHSLTKLNKWMCAIHCMHKATVPLSDINKVVSETAKEYQSPEDIVLDSD